MTRESFFPHVATAYNDVRLIKLIEAEGAVGYGCYWHLLEFLRLQHRYVGNLVALNMLAKQMRTSCKRMLRIVTDFNLFVVEDEAFYSPDLCARMQPLDDKRAAMSRQCRRAAEVKWLKHRGGADASAPIIEEKSRVREEISPLNPPVGEVANSREDVTRNDERKEEEEYLPLPAMPDSALPEASPSVASKRFSSPEEFCNYIRNLNTEAAAPPASPPGGVLAPAPNKWPSAPIAPNEVASALPAPIPGYAYNKQTHNLDGLLDNLRRHRITNPDEVAAILRMSDYGRIGNEVWQVLFHTDWPKIKMPGAYVIKKLRRES